MQQLTPVVKNLLILNILMFIAQNLLPDITPILALFAPWGEYFLPIQLVTHFFMHGGIGHIFFNMFALVTFGAVLEALWGPKRFLIYYFVCAFGAALMHIGYAYFTNDMQLNPEANFPVVGASGAIFGLLIAFAVNFPDYKLMLIFFPVPIKARYFIPVLILIELFLGFKSFGGDNVAHFAHLGGALFGYLFMRFWWKFGDTGKRN
jgi:membrane associated rhomboid family serine protease